MKVPPKGFGLSRFIAPTLVCPDCGTPPYYEATPQGDILKCECLLQEWEIDD